MDRVLSLPITITLGVTNQCNLNCKHCFASAKKAYRNEMDTAEILKLADMLSALKIFRVEISGGEPMARKDLFLILERLAEQKVRLSMNTNATLVTQPIAQHLAEIPIHDGVSVSFDGASARSHDVLRGPGSFNKAIKGIENLGRAGLRFKFFSVVNKHNQHELPEMAKMAQELGAWSIDFNCLVRGGRAGHFLKELELSVMERGRACEEVLALSEKFPNSISGYYLGWAKRMRKFKRLTPKNGSEANNLGYCGAATKSCSIRADGSVVPCHSLWDAKAGNIREQSFIEIWRHSPVFNEIRAAANVSLNEVTGCKSCEYKFACNGGCRAAGYYAEGHFRACDPFCWLNGQKEEGSHEFG